MLLFFRIRVLVVPRGRDVSDDEVSCSRVEP